MTYNMDSSDQFIWYMVILYIGYNGIWVICVVINLLSSIDTNKLLYKKYLLL